MKAAVKILFLIVAASLLSCERHRRCPEVLICSNPPPQLSLKIVNPNFIEGFVDEDGSPKKDLAYLYYKNNGAETKVDSWFDYYYSVNKYVLFESFEAGKLSAFNGVKDFYLKLGTETYTLFFNVETRETRCCGNAYDYKNIKINGIEQTYAEGDYTLEIKQKQIPTAN